MEILFTEEQWNEQFKNACNFYKEIIEKIYTKTLQQANHYEQDLSNGFESKLQTNISIFDKLKLAIEKRFYQKVEQN